MPASLLLALLQPVIVTVPPPPKVPTAVNGYFASAGEILDGCNSNVVKCSGYVVAIADHVALLQTAGVTKQVVCIPKKTTSIDLTQTVAAALRKEPSVALKGPAAALVHNALVLGYPCKN